MVRCTDAAMPKIKSKTKKMKKRVSKKEGKDVQLQDFTSRGRSGSRDTAVMPPLQESALQKRKRRRKTNSTVDMSEELAVANGNIDHFGADSEGTTTPITRKTKRKCRKTNATENYSIDLRAENDDVITDIQSPLPQQSLFFTPHGLSQSVGKVFVDGNREVHRSFSRRESGAPAGLMVDYSDQIQSWTKRDVAMRVHSGFRVIGLFSQGLLAGFAVWSIIVVYILAGDRMSTLTNLLVQYHPLAYLSQSLQYLLLTISTVSAFDRLNLGKTSTVLSRLLTLDSAALTSVLYFISLTLSLSQQMTSDRINHYPSANHTLWPPSSEQQILRPWIAVNFVVALLAGVAWAVISTGPDIDYTEEFLMSMEVQGNPRGEGLDVPT